MNDIALVIAGSGGGVADGFVARYGTPTVANTVGTSLVVPYTVPAAQSGFDSLLVIAAAVGAPYAWFDDSTLGGVALPDLTVSGPDGSEVTSMIGNVLMRGWRIFNPTPGATSLSLAIDQASPMAVWMHTFTAVPETQPEPTLGFAGTNPVGGYGGTGLTFLMLGATSPPAHDEVDPLYQSVGSTTTAVPDGGTALSLELQWYEGTDEPDVLIHDVGAEAELAWLATAIDLDAA